MRIVVLLLTLLFTYNLSAQDPLIQKDNEALEAVAIKITKIYDDQLGLDGKQYVLFEKKVEEYLIREENIHNNFSGEEKLDKLYKLTKAESMEMRNVLTQPQYDLYLRIKPQIQPLAKIDTETN
jgi:hypothetical protein